MIKIENVEICGLEPAIRGARNPYNSWSKSDSEWDWVEDPSPINPNDPGMMYVLGDNDLSLMRRLAAAGSDHRKFMRMITVYADIIAPRYWWTEYDTYKVGTVANSCSTMHKIADKEFTLDDFSYEHLGVSVTAEKNDGEAVFQNLWIESIKQTISHLNVARNFYIGEKDDELKKEYWWQMIQLLPQSYNQRRTVMLNYEVLRNMYHSRKAHKLDEWVDFCAWIETLPYSELITGTEGEKA